MFVYNSDKSYWVTIDKDKNEEAFNELDLKIKTEGFHGQKGYFHAIFSRSAESVKINVKRILPLKPW